MTPEEVKKEIVEWYCRLCPLDCEMGKDYICNLKARLSEKLTEYRDSIVDSAPDSCIRLDAKPPYEPCMNFAVAEWKQRMKGGRG
jgi:hypothetical protein